MSSSGSSSKCAHGRNCRLMTAGRRGNNISRCGSFRLNAKTTSGSAGRSIAAYRRSGDESFPCDPCLVQALRHPPGCPHPHPPPRNNCHRDRWRRHNMLRRRNRNRERWHRHRNMLRRLNRERWRRHRSILLRPNHSPGRWRRRRIILLRLNHSQGRRRRTIRPHRNCSLGQPRRHPSIHRRRKRAQGTPRAFLLRRRSRSRAALRRRSSARVVSVVLAGRLKFPRTPQSRPSRARASLAGWARLFMKGCCSRR